MKGEQETGVTAHLIEDERVDTGRIITQSRIKIYASDTDGMLRYRLASLSEKVLKKALRMVLVGKTSNFTKQVESEASYYPTAGSLRLPSETTAFTLSLTGALASWGLLLVYAAVPEEGETTIASVLDGVAIVGIMVGPSLGYFYGGRWGRGLLMTGLRVGVSVAAMAYSLYHDESDKTAIAALWLGTLIGSAIYECATVKSAVRKHNAAHLAKRNLKLAVAPVPVRRGAGLSVQLSF